jgi:hypothetical protein
MNYRQIVSTILYNIGQTERNLDGLHERGDVAAVDKLTYRLRTLKMLSAALADDSYDAIKKYLGDNGK